MTGTRESIRVDRVCKPLVEFNGFGNLIEVANTQFDEVFALDDPDIWATDMMTGFEVNKISSLSLTQAKELKSALNEVRNTRDEPIVRNVQKVMAVYPKKLVVNLEDTDEKLALERRDILNVFSQITGKDLPYHPLHLCLRIGSFVGGQEVSMALRQLRESQPVSIKLGKTVADLMVRNVKKSI